MTKTQYTFPPGSTVLVTGANAYIGSHVINILLSLGYHVRGTVRTPRPWLNEYFDACYGKGLFETILIPDISDHSAFDNALTGVSGVVHLVCTAFSISIIFKPLEQNELIHVGTSYAMGSSKQRSRRIHCRWDFKCSPSRI
jgi:nucleoside-diphosphate-sugar epimerase